MLGTFKNRKKKYKGVKDKIYRLKGIDIVHLKYTCLTRSVGQYPVSLPRIPWGETITAKVPNEIRGDNYAVKIA